jgi:hypothetical protein
VIESAFAATLAEAPSGASSFFGRLVIAMKAAMLPFGLRLQADG